MKTSLLVKIGFTIPLRFSKYKRIFSRGAFQAFLEECDVVLRAVQERLQKLRPLPREPLWSATIALENSVRIPMCVPLRLVKPAQLMMSTTSAIQGFGR